MTICTERKDSEILVLPVEEKKIRFSIVYITEKETK